MLSGSSFQLSSLSGAGSSHEKIDGLVFFLLPYRYRYPPYSSNFLTRLLKFPVPYIPYFRYRICPFSLSYLSYLLPLVFLPIFHYTPLVIPTTISIYHIPILRSYLSPLLVFPLLLMILAIFTALYLR